LAAFFLADFLVGFFLPAARFAAVAFFGAAGLLPARADLFAAFFLDRTVLRAAGLRAADFFLPAGRRSVFLLFLTALAAAFFFVPRFLALAIKVSCQSVLPDYVPPGHKLDLR
jgi:hypothetical protein